MVQIPPVAWPAELVEQGPVEDPFILLTGSATIGLVQQRVMALRVNPATLAVDYRVDLDEESYADFQFEEMFDELTFLTEVDRSALVTIEGGSYVVWMIPTGTAH